MARITIDPMTRIEGHLRIDVEIEGGKVKDAWTTGTLFRGFELILQGRDPRDAWHITQRICGVCPTSHGHASSMSMDDAFKVKPPDNGRIIRNIIEGAQFVHSHILWFYHLNALDYVDVVSALKAQPKEASLKKVQAKLKSFVESGQLGPFANAYWGHPAYKLPPDVNLLAVAHYLEALEMQAKAAQVSALFGGRMPMTMTSPPGGVTHVPSVDDLKNYLFRVKELQDWIDNVFIADVMAIAPFYLGYAGVGKGHGNFLSWGVFEDASFDPKKRLLPRGAIFAADFPKVHEAKAEDVTEDTTHGWYKDGKPLNPAVGVDGAGLYRIRRKQEVHLGQGAPPPGQTDGGRRPLPDARRLCVGPAHGQEADRRHAQGDRPCGRAAGALRGHRPDRRTGARVQAGGGRHAPVGSRSHREHQEREHRGL